MVGAWQPIKLALPVLSPVPFEPLQALELYQRMAVSENLLLTWSADPRLTLIPGAAAVALLGLLFDHIATGGVHTGSEGTYLKRAQKKEKSGDMRKAISYYDKVLKLEPQSAQARLARGRIKVGMENYEDAIKDFDAVIENDPQNELARIYRGSALMSANNLDAAIADFTVAIDMYQDNQYSYLSRAECFMHMGKYQKANKDFQMALKIDPYLAPAHMGKARAMSALADQYTPQDAVKILRSARKHVDTALQLGNDDLQLEDASDLLEQILAKLKILES